MACSSTEEKYGYEDCRFEKDVDENFHCSICYNVLKEPRMCRNNEHVFCLACISEHLKVNSQTCPECNEYLSVDTLRRPRLVNNYLSKLKINCDYASRGCAQFICLEDLENHVASCGLAPVLCSNENCGMEINKQERDHHETVVCEYRKVKCHDCEQIQEVVGKLEGSLIELDGKVEAANEKMQSNHVEMKKVVGKLKGSLVEMNKKFDEKVEAARDDARHEMKKVKNEVKEVRKEVKGMKANLSKVNKDMDEVKFMMSQMLTKLEMLQLLNNLPFPTEGVLNTPRGDILIAGGDGRSSKTGKSAEIYSWERNCWFEVSPMNGRHIKGSSFIYDDQLFVVGGSYSETIETLDLNDLPLKWLECPEELPYKSDAHQTVVCDQRIIHIGGDLYRKGRSNAISELQLTSPPIMKELGHMSKPRFCHGAEVFEDKVLIFGGVNEHSNVFDSVLEFDPKKNECKEMPLLPYPVTRMATVRWRDKVYVLGGRDRDGQVLNDVIMYHCKTGKTTFLPSMLERRSDCCAVVTGDRIVVMGGENERHETLNSVECFKLSGPRWEYLPDMNEARWSAVAEALPAKGLTSDMYFDDLYS